MTIVTDLACCESFVLEVRWTCIFIMRTLGRLLDLEYNFRWNKLGVVNSDRFHDPQRRACRARDDGPKAQAVLFLYEHGGAPSLPYGVSFIHGRDNGLVMKKLLRLQKPAWAVAVGGTGGKPHSSAAAARCS